MTTERGEFTPRFNRDNLPSDPADWPIFFKRHGTRMLRMVGPFEVATTEGVMRCEDGWLAMDAGGNPYPIAAEEQARSYQP